METKRTTDRATEYANLLQKVVNAYTSKDVQVDGKPIMNGSGVQLNLRVDSWDYGKVCGARGAQIQALKTVFEFIGARAKFVIRIMLLEPEDDTGRRIRQNDEIAAEAQRRGLGSFGEAKYDREKILGIFDELVGRILVKQFQTDIYEEGEKAIIEVRPHEDEQQLSNQLAPYLDAIFLAIGKHHGKDIDVESKLAIKL